MGSPRYFGFANCCVFTIPPSASSRTGMTRMRLNGPSVHVIHQREIPKHLLAVAVALFRMELHAENIAVADARRDLVAVHGRADHHLRTVALEVERVDV